MLNPSINLIRWIECILTYRIGPNLSLKFDFISQEWRLSLSGINTNIIMPANNKLYDLEPNLLHLDCKHLCIDYTFLSQKPYYLVALGMIHKGPLCVTSNHLQAINLNYDIPGFIYYFLCRLEEINPSIDDLDDYSRFKSSRSIAHANNFLHRPVVDEWIQLLRELIAYYCPKFPLSPLHFRIEPTHDVDHPSAFSFLSNKTAVKAAFSYFAKTRDPSIFCRAIKIRCNSHHHLHEEDPYNTFNWLMEQSESVGIASRFYFKTGSTDKQKDPYYIFDSPIISNLLKEISSRGHLVGFHPSFNTYMNYTDFTREAKRFFKSCEILNILQPEWGGRMHYLRWSWPSTAHLWSNHGFHYDSTLGYTSMPGFRCGTCHDYPMFDPLSDKPIGLIQKPLILMEHGIPSSNNRSNYKYSEKSYLFVDQLLGRCKKVSGTFRFLWHNSNLSNHEDRTLYSYLIQQGLS